MKTLILSLFETTIYPADILVKTTLENRMYIKRKLSNGVTSVSEASI